MSILATPKTYDDSFVSVAATTHVAVASIELPSVRERQAMIMQERLTELAAQCRGRVAVGFTEVTDMTSAAINALIEVSTACRARGGRLVIFGLQKPLRKVFSTTGLDKLLTVAADADSALRLFHPRPKWSLFGRAA